MTMGITSPTSTTGQILKNGSAVISFDANNNATFSGNVAPSVNPTMRNRIINGAMMIDQRNAGASVTGNNGTFSVDRWFADTSASSKFTMQQNAGSVTPPIGFTNYLGVTSSSAYSVTSGDYFLLEQRIEGLNIADLGWGTANAKTVTLSFQVYSSLTGTFGGALGNNGNNQSYPFSYTISSANTWTTVSITISGATSGTWLTTNGTGIKVFFGLGVGSTYSGTAGAWSGSLLLSATGATSVVGTNGATFYLTGVQLEVGSVATPFEQRLYGTELALCQRYYWQITGDASNPAYIGTGWRVGISSQQIIFKPMTTMRTNPTFGYGGTITIQDSSASGTVNSYNTLQSTPNSVGVILVAPVAFSGTVAIANTSASASSYVYLSAEL